MGFDLKRWDESISSPEHGPLQVVGGPPLACREDCCARRFLKMQKIRNEFQAFRVNFEPVKLCSLNRCKSGRGALVIAGDLKGEKTRFLTMLMICIIHFSVVEVITFRQEQW